jgi:hypothetical protein
MEVATGGVGSNKSYATKIFNETIQQFDSSRSHVLEI